MKQLMLVELKQFSLCIRYFDADVNKIREDFLQFVPVHSTTGLELAKTIISTLSALGLNLQHMRGQGYDGAAIWEEYLEEFKHFKQRIF